MVLRNKHFVKRMQVYFEFQGPLESDGKDISVTLKPKQVITVVGALSWTVNSSPQVLSGSKLYSMFQLNSLLFLNQVSENVFPTLFKVHNCFPGRLRT